MDAVLHTERLLVRLWTLEDADEAFSIYRDPDIGCYVPGGAHATPEQTRAWLEQRINGCANGTGLGFWALVEKDSGRIIGGVMLDRDTIGTRADVRLGFHLDHKAHEQGYAEEVAHALLRYGFSDLQLDRIVGVVLPDDLLSRRALQKVGMLDEGSELFGDVHVGIMAIHRSLEDGRGPFGVPA